MVCTIPYPYATDGHVDEASGSDTPYSTPPPMARPAARPVVGFFGSSRSISSVSSSDSPDDYSSFSSPDTPLQFSRIAFSWEQIPGIPKKDIPKKKDSSLSQLLLPLPPAGKKTELIGRKQSLLEEISPKNSFKRDPFFVALMECSKDDGREQYAGSLRNIWKGLKGSKNYGFGFIEMYTSCKRTCSVSESVVYLPRSRSYSLLNPRSS